MRVKKVDHNFVVSLKFNTECYVSDRLYVKRCILFQCKSLSVLLVMVCDMRFDLPNLLPRDKIHDIEIFALMLFLIDIMN